MRFIIHLVRNLPPRFRHVVSHPLVRSTTLPYLKRKADRSLHRRRSRRHTATPKFLLIVSSLVFCSTTTYFLAITVQYLKWFSQLRDVDPENAATALSSFIQFSWPVELVASMLGTFNVRHRSSILFPNLRLQFTAGNSVLVWRAAILWKQETFVPRVLWGFFCCQSGKSTSSMSTEQLLTRRLVISCAAFINQAVVLSRTDGTDTTSFMNLYTPAMFISLVVNLVATLLVVVRTW